MKGVPVKIFDWPVFFHIWIKYRDLQISNLKSKYGKIWTRKISQFGATVQDVDLIRNQKIEIKPSKQV